MRSCAGWRWGLHDAGRSGRDDDLWSVQKAAQEAWQVGVRHADLALLLVQLQLDCHAADAAEAVLADAPRAAATPTGRMLRAGLLLQRGDPERAGGLLLDLLHRERTWRSLALLAAVYEDVGDEAAADLLYAEAGEELDARQLATLAWLECQRARLRLATDRVEAPIGICGVPSLPRPGGQSPRCEVGGSTREATWRRRQQHGDRWLRRPTDPIMPRQPPLLQPGQDRSRRPSAGQERARTGFATARRRWPYRYAHHEVDWHLHVDLDEELALALARSDYRQRPARRQAARLAEALRAFGDREAADRLAEDHLQRRRQARAGLAGALARANSTIAASA